MTPDSLRADSMRWKFVARQARVASHGLEPAENRNVGSARLALQRAAESMEIAADRLRDAANDLEAQP